jgi:hypothetical protein
MLNFTDDSIKQQAVKGDITTCSLLIILNPYSWENLNKSFYA